MTKANPKVRFLVGQSRVLGMTYGISFLVSRLLCEDSQLMPEQRIQHPADGGRS